MGGMELKVIKAVWGMPGTWESRFRQIAEAGYDGVESPMPGAADEPEFRRAAERYGLDLILQIYTEGPDHAASFEEQARRAASFRPLLINSHSAKDSMFFEEQVEFFKRALKAEQEVGVPIAHETHRGRATYVPWNTARLLRELADLKIVADFSHWCNVCESMLDDQEDHLFCSPRSLVRPVICILSRIPTSRSSTCGKSAKPWATGFEAGSRAGSVNAGTASILAENQPILSIQSTFFSYNRHGVALKGTMPILIWKRVSL